MPYFIATVHNCKHEIIIHLFSSLRLPLLNRLKILMIMPRDLGWFFSWIFFWLKLFSQIISKREFRWCHSNIVFSNDSENTFNRVLLADDCRWENWSRCRCWFSGRSGFRCRGWGRCSTERVLKRGKNIILGHAQEFSSEWISCSLDPTTKNYEF